MKIKNLTPNQQFTIKGHRGVKTFKRISAGMAMCTNQDGETRFYSLETEVMTKEANPYNYGEKHAV